jgi:hypothetical protein
MRVGLFDRAERTNQINPKLKDSYFEVIINDKVKFIHKQTAGWVLTKTQQQTHVLWNTS